MPAGTAEVLAIRPGVGRVVLVVVAHADDAAMFIGGTVAGWSDAGWRVVLVRVTDDRWDSVGLDEAATVEANARELRAAAAILGIAEVIELGYPTDVLGDASEVELRERIIRLVRRHRPYALVTFDPYGMFGEDNQDHLTVAAAVDESFWTSQFDLHHPEHRDEGLEPHGAFERWYFARRVVEVTTVVDVSATIDRKVAAALAHRTMLLNYINQLRLQARTGGWRVGALDEAAEAGDVGIIGDFIREGTRRTGRRHGVDYGEEFRVVRFGGLDTVLDTLGEVR